MKKITMNILRFNIIVLITLSTVFTTPCLSINIDSLQTVLRVQTGIQRLENLIVLGNAMMKKDRPSSNTYFKEALSMYNKDEKKQFADLSYKIANNYFVLRNNDSAIVYYGKALIAYEGTNDTLNIMKTSTMRGLSYQRMGEFGTSAKHFKTGIRLFYPYWKFHEGENNIGKKHLTTMMTNYGISLYNMGQYDSSLYYATEAYKINMEIGVSSKQIGKSLVNIGIAYLGANRNSESLQYFNDALDRFIPIKDSFNIRKCYNNIGLTYKQLGEIDDAINNYNKSLEISRAAKDNKGISTSLINLSSLFAKSGETKKAEKSLLEALIIGEKLNNKNLISNSLQNLSNIYWETGNLEKALLYARKAEVVIKETDNMDMLKDNKLLLSNIYEDMGDFNKSLVHHKLYFTLHDSLFNSDNTERFNRLQTEFETLQKEQEIEILKIDKQNQLLENNILKNQQRTTIVVSGLIIVLLVIVGFMIFIKRKKDKLIHHQKELYHKKEKQFAQLELEKSKIKEEELQQSILYKSKQLSTHALHMMQKNSMLQNIQSSLKEISKKVSSDDKPGFKRISLEISKSLRSHKEWDVFKLYFEEVNRTFYGSLNKLNPNLTTNDHRLCALIKLNMNSKEMASVLNVAPNSIKSSRYRLKKKLGLDTEADLEEFIRNIG